MSWWPDRTPRGEEILSPPEKPLGSTNPGESGAGTGPRNERARDDLQGIRVRRRLRVTSS